MGIRYHIDIPLDDAERMKVHKDLIKSKSFLYKLYSEWYEIFLNESLYLPEGNMVEIGSGGGFLKEKIPSLIATDILPSPDNDLTFSALDMPFENSSISAIFMLNVFHHLPDASDFLRETDRVLRKNGKVIMIEPANSKWGRLIYSRLHHEPFIPESDWTIVDTGPLSGANGALPWIIFERDKDRFCREFPSLEIEDISYHTPLRYLLSGGLSFKSLVPDFTFGFFRSVDQMLSLISKQISMFMTIKIRKIS